MRLQRLSEDWRLVQLSETLARVTFPAPHVEVFRLVSNLHAVAKITRLPMWKRQTRSGFPLLLLMTTCFAHARAYRAHDSSSQIAKI